MTKMFQSNQGQFLNVAILKSGNFNRNQLGSNVQICELSNFGPFNWQVNGIEVSPKPTNHEVFARYSEVLDKVKTNTPILVRHYGSLSTLDLNLRQIAMQILSLYEQIRLLSLKAVIFPTTSSHHLDSLILEISCELANVAQVFLRETIIKDRFLPMLKKNGFQAALPSKAVISEFELGDNKEFLQKLVSENLDSSFWNSKYISNFYLATFYLILNQMLIYKNKIKLIIFNRQQAVKIKDLSKRSLINNIQLYLSQKNSLILLNKYEKEDAVHIIKHLENCKKNKSKPLILFAHFQPEATSFPEGGQYYNHVDLISQLRASKFRGPVIYKEHPATYLYGGKNLSFEVGTYRDTEYYENLHKLGCLFANQEILNSIYEFLPVTITGSIAFQRSMEGKDTVVAGIPWFNSLPGLIPFEVFNHNSGDLLKTDSVKFSHLPESSYQALRDIIDYKTCGNFQMLRHPETKNEYLKLIKYLSQI
jgi:hypothetical protein